VQLILVSRHFKAARTVTIMPRHLLAAGILFIACVLATAGALNWAGGLWRNGGTADEVPAVQAEAAQRHAASNLQAMAARLGELQARVLHLDSIGEKLAGLAGLRREKPDGIGGQGGAFVPAPLSEGELQREIDRLGQEVSVRSEELSALEARLLEKRVRERLLPTTLPVRDAYLGSPFGHRADPIAGLRAMHEGIDFNAPPGTPVLAAADGVILSAGWDGDFGKLIEVDHGGGLTTRYAHLSRMDVKAGAVIKRGELLGAVGTTGRSTGPHLHFEVRMLGVAQNPAQFLALGEEYAQLKRR
jgi:murein DD-endopeptidase MepM/ murein hydrolase activator NlpD